MRKEYLQKIKDYMRNAINNGISSDFKYELDTELAKIGLTNQVHESDLNDYLTCCMIAFDAAMKDKKLRDRRKMIQASL